MSAENAEYLLRWMNGQENTASQENLDRNMNRVDNQADQDSNEGSHTPSSYRSLWQSQESVVPESPVVEQRQQDPLGLGVGLQNDQNIFSTLQDILKKVSSIDKRIEDERKFRIEGQVKKDLSLIAKRNFSTNLFVVTETCKNEVKTYIEQKMTRDARVAELKEAISFIKRKTSVELRPSVYRKLKNTMDKSPIEQTRDLFRPYIDPCVLHGEETNVYRRQITLIMRLVHRNHPEKGTFWKKVSRLFNKFEAETPDKRAALFRKLQEREENV